jgi:hypothetical protein
VRLSAPASGGPPSTAVATTGQTATGWAGGRAGGGTAVVTVYAVCTT